ncbi:MAG: hypothetical protein A4E55_01270 [Pelotomaculum sp. PtaU1.Bin035]|nr:MAG: hypothetical protein A4E55_01270 [Pelotomaculum sp. PtaU1.Bin035]
MEEYRITREQLDRYRAGWLEYKQRKELDLAVRYNDAMARARLAAGHIKQRYKCRVFLFGSLLLKDRFGEHSDIDLAVADLAPETNFWQLYSEVMNILHPFDFDLVELERVDPAVRENILKGGVEL